MQVSLAGDLGLLVKVPALTLWWMNMLGLMGLMGLANNVYASFGVVSKELELEASQEVFTGSLHR